MKLKPRIRKPLFADGWKPRVKWIVSLRRPALASSEKIVKMTRSCDSLEDGRKIAETYFKRGWTEAWVYEKIPA